MSTSVKHLNTRELPSLTQTPEVPFSLGCEAGKLVCQQNLRFLPGKRLVVKAQLNGQDVIAKCFFGPNAKRDMQREVRGIQGFHKSGIQTPELVHHSGDDNFAVAVTACLDPVTSFEDIWNSELDQLERKHWLNKSHP